MHSSERQWSIAAKSITKGERKGDALSRTAPVRRPDAAAIMATVKRPDDAI